MADRTVRVRLSANTSQYEGSLDRAARKTDDLNRKADRFDGSRFVARIDLNTGNADRSLSSISTRLKKYAGTTAKAKATADTSEAHRRLQALNGELSALNGQTFEPDVELKIVKARQQAAELEAQLARLGSEESSPQVDLDIAEASAKLAVLRGQLRAFDGKTYAAEATVKTDTAVRNTSTLSNAIMALGPAAVTTGAVATGAIGGMTPVLGVVGAAAGTTMAAFAGLGDAIEAMNEYALDPSAENLEKVQEATATLSETSVEFARYISGDLLPQLRELQHTAADGMLPGVQEGLQSLETILPKINSLVGTTATTLGELAARAGEGLTTEPWTRYFEYLKGEASTTLVQLAESLGNFATGFAELQMAFDPVFDDIVAGLKSMSEEFLNWSSTLDTNQGFQEFISYVRENGPLLVSTLGDIMSAILAITEAAAPFGPIMLETLGALARALEAVVSIPGVGPTLVGIATAIGTLNLALKAFQGAKLSLLGQMLTGMGGKARTAAAGTTVLAGSMDTASKRSGRFSSGLSRIGNTLPLIGAGVIAADLAISSFTVSTDEAVTAMNKGGAAADKAAESVGLQTAAFHTGVSAIESATGANLGWLHSTQDWIAENVLGISTLGSLSDKMAEQAASATDLENAQRQLSRAQGDYTQALDEFGPSSVQARNALQQLNAATKQQKIEQIAAQYGISDTTAEILAQGQAEQQAQAAKENLNSAQERLNSAVAQYGPNSSQATDAMLALQTAQVEMATAAKRGEKGMRGYAQTLSQMASDSNGKLTPALRTMIAELDGTGLAAAGATVKIDATGKAVATLPSGHTVEIIANASGALQQLGMVSASLTNIPVGKSINVGVISAQAQSALQSIGIEVTTLPDGTVEVRANDQQARATLSIFQQYAGSIQADPSIGADPAKAYATMLKLINDVRRQRGEIPLDANTAPANQQVLDAINRFNTLSAEADLNANAQPATRALNLWRDTANGTSATSTHNANSAPAHNSSNSWWRAALGLAPVSTHGANTAPANNASNSWFRAALGMGPVSTHGANTGPANSASSSWFGWAAGMFPVAGVGANTGSASSAVSSLVGWINGLVGTVTVVANALGFSGGGIAQPMAEGGLVNGPNVIANDAGNHLEEFRGHKTRRMPPGGARMVPPNTWRVVGDRMDVPELYAPLDGSDRSLGLIAQGAKAFGYGLIPHSAIKGSDGPSLASAASAPDSGLSDAFGTLTDVLSDIEWPAPQPVNVPRILQEAGNTVQRTINNYLEVNNPIRERTSESLQSELSRWADLGIFADD